MAFPPDESKLVSIFVQALLYGAYVVLFFATTQMLVTRRSRISGVGGTHRSMLFITLLMFGIATMHIAVNFTRIIKAFIIFRDEPGGPAAFFDRLSEFTQMFGSTLYVAQTLLGDTIALMRCYYVWDRNILVVVFPMLLLLGSAATGVGILYSFDKTVPQAQIFVDQLSQWIISFFSMTFATNVICTALVGYRVWRINKKGIGFSSSHRRLRSVMVLIVESGAVYSAALMALLILYEADSWFQYVVLDAITPTVGIVFSVIMYRILTGTSSAAGETLLLDEDGVDMHRMQTNGCSRSKVHSDLDVT